MNYKWIYGLIFLLGCSSSKNVGDQKKTGNLTIELISSTKKGEYFDFNFAIKNNTNRPVTILKHQGVKERDKKNVVIAAAFYNMEFLPYDVMCEYELEFMDQEIIENKKFQIDSDFVNIESKKKYLFNVKSKDYLLGICDENAKNFKVVIKYDPRKQYFQKQYFENQYKFAKESQQYFEKLSNSYQSTITSDTIIVKL